MLAELPTWLTDAGTIAGVIIATAAVLGLLTRAKPVRWVWRQLIGEPVGRWAGGIVSAQVDPVRTDIAELRTDLSTNTVDLKALRVELVNHMGAAEDLRAADIADRDRRQDEMDRWRTDVRDDVAEIKTGLGTVHRRIDSALQRLAEGNPEVRP